MPSKHFGPEQQRHVLAVYDPYKIKNKNNNKIIIGLGMWLSDIAHASYEALDFIPGTIMNK